MTGSARRIVSAGLIGLSLAGGWASLNNAAWSADGKDVKKDETKELAAEHAAVRKSLGKAKASLSDAIKAAVAKQPGGKAVEAYFEAEGKALFYQVVVVGGGKHKAMLVDGELGHVMGVVAAEEGGKAERDMKDAIAKSKISLTTAIDVALKKHPNAKAFDAHPDLDKGKTVIDVELLDGKKLLEVFIDPASGAILSEAEIKD